MASHKGLWRHGAIAEAGILRYFIATSPEVTFDVREIYPEVVSLTVTRRDLLKRTLGAGTLLALTDVAGAPSAEASTGELKIQGAKETRSICPYCSVGCGIVFYSKDDELISAHGDPEHPINEGGLCSKGASVMTLRLVADKNGQYSPNPSRVTTVKYRAPGATDWVEKDWDWAVKRIAQKVKETRDATFERTDKAGVTVNRTLAMAHIGSAALDNEENYLLSKMQRALGMVRVEHHARL